MKLAFAQQIFEIYSNIKFHENPSNRIRVLSCGRTDKNDRAVSRSSQFCQSAQKKKPVDKLAFSDLIALKAIHFVMLQTQQTIKQTILFVDHNLYLSNIKPSYMYMFRFCKSHHQAVSLKKET